MDLTPDTADDSGGFSVGLDYVIKDLSHAPQLNGIITRCFAWLPDLNRVIVTLPGGLELALLPKFLRTAGSPDVAAAIGRDAVSYASRANQGVIGRPAYIKAAASIPPLGRNNIRPEPLTMADIESISKATIEAKITAVPELPPPTRNQFESFDLQDNESSPSVPHPLPLLEPSVIAQAVTVQPTYKLKGSGEGLCDPQRLSVRHALDTSEQRLANGGRTGMFLMDGGGTGKGRIFAGIVLENSMQARRRHLWVGGSPEAFADVQRDLHAVTGGRVAAFQLGMLEYDALEDQGYREGVCYATYTVFAGSTKKKGKRLTRIEQLIEWLGGTSFEGVIVFDDFYRVKPLVGAGKSPALALCVEDVQKRLPSARVVYGSSSALFNPRELQLAERLGLISLATHVSHTSAYCQSVFSRLESASSSEFEGVLAKLKSAGRLQCRWASLALCSALVKESKADEKMLRTISQSVVLWSELWTSMTDSLRELAERKLGNAYDSSDDDHNGSPRHTSNNQSAVPSEGGEQTISSSVSGEIGQMTRTFWTGHIAYFRSLTLMLKLGDIRKAAEGAIKESKQVVISLQGTGDEMELLSPQDILMSVVNRMRGESGLGLSRKERERERERDKAKVKQLDRDSLNFQKIDKAAVVLKSQDIPDADRPLTRRETQRRSGKSLTVMDSSDDSDVPPPPEKKRLIAQPEKVSRYSGSVKIDEFGQRFYTFGPPRLSLGQRDTIPCVQRVFALPCRRKSLLKQKGVSVGATGQVVAIGAVHTNNDEMSEADDIAGSEDENMEISTSKTGREVDSDGGIDWYSKITSISGLPDCSAIDLLIDELGGVNCVAELSARRSRYVPRRGGEGKVLTVRSCEHENLTDRAAFMAGRKSIAILADTCALGITLPATQPLLHIYAELPIQPGKAYHHATRTYCAGARQGVEYLVLTSKMGGDRYLGGAVIDELKSYGLVKVQLDDPIKRGYNFDINRSRHAVDFLLPTLFQTGWSKPGMSIADTDRKLLMAVARSLEIIGWNPKYADRRTDSGFKLLLRLRGLPFDLQEPFFDVFVSIMEQIRDVKSN